MSKYHGLISAAEESAILSQLRDERQREQGFGALVRVFGPPLHRHLLRMLQSSADVDDVLQNTFIKVYRNFDRFREESKLSTWLYRIATNEALAWMRSQQRRERRISSEDPALTAGRSLRADPFFDGDAAQLELQKALAALPPKQRAVFLLRYYDELPYAEISQITGTSEGALKASYHLAVKKIELKLKAYAQ